MTKKIRGSMNTLVDLIVPFWNSYDYIYGCLDKVEAAMGDIPYRIIVSDDGNELGEKRTDLVEYVHEMGGKVARNPKNSGYPVAVNFGAMRGRSPLIFVLTADVECEEGAGEAIVKAMDDPKIGLVGMKLLFPKDSTDPGRPAGKVQHVGIHTDIRGNMVHTYVGWNNDNPKVDQVRDVFAVTGAAFMTRRKLWDRVGGLDEIYGLGTFEDVAYAMKVRELGYNIIVETDAVAHHHVGGSVEESKRGFPLKQNRMKFMQIWGEKLMYTEWKVKK